MASTGKRSFTTGVSARSKRARRSLLPDILSGATMANRAQNSGKGFESLPPSPIASVRFRFLKSLDLNSLGIGLNAVTSCFGWALVEWKPLDHQFRAETGIKSAEDFVEVCDVVEVKDDTYEEGMTDLNLGIGDEPVLDWLSHYRCLRITR